MSVLKAKFASALKSAPAFLAAVMPGNAAAAVGTPDPTVVLETLEGKSTRFKVADVPALLVKTLGPLVTQALRTASSQSASGRR